MLIGEPCRALEDEPASSPAPNAPSAGMMYHFEGFRLDPVARGLWFGDTELRLTFRLFEILLALVRANDATLSRQDLLDAVWADRVVDDGNLARAVSSLRDALRKAGLTRNIIVTVPGRGYRLACNVVAEQIVAVPSAAAEAPAPPASRVETRPVPRGPSHAIMWVAALVVVLGVAAGGILWGIGRQAPGPLTHSLAVLPFANAAGTEAGQRLAEGLPAALVDALADLRGVRVVSQQSAFPIGRSGASSQEIGQRLDVGFLVRGSVAWSGHLISVRARLIDASTGREIWARAFSRGDDDLQALQDELVGAVIGSLEPGHGADTRAVAGTTADARAFDAYLKAIGHRSEVDQQANAQALAEFGEAIRIDPLFALAYAQRGRALVYAAVNGGQADRVKSDELFRQALDDVRHAVTLSPNLGIAYATLGYILKCQLQDLPGAVDAYRRAAALMPGNSTVLMSQAFMNLDLGHIDQAVAGARQAVALNPLSGSAHLMSATLLSTARQFPEAAEELGRAALLPTTNPAETRAYSAHLAILRHDPVKAAALCAQGQDARDAQCLAWAYHALGDHDRALGALQRLRALLGERGAYEYAEIYAQWGDAQQAGFWLMTALRLKLPSLIEVKVDPLLDPIRATTPYKDIVARLNFPP